MKASCLLVIAIAIAAVGCQSPERGQAGAPATGTIKAEALDAPDYDAPISPAGSETVFIPFSIGIDRHKAGPRPEPVPFLKREFVSRGTTPTAVNQSASSRLAMDFEYTFNVGNYGTWSNLVCFDRKTGTSRLLLDHRAVMTRFFYPQLEVPRVGVPGTAEFERPSTTPAWPKDWLLFGIGDVDSDKNGYLDSADATAAYTTDLAGLGLTRVTPADEQFVSVAPQPGGVWLLLTTRVDADHDGVFTGKMDETRYCALSVTDRTKAVPMLLAEVRERAVKIVTEGKTP